MLSAVDRRLYAQSGEGVAVPGRFQAIHSAGSARIARTSWELRVRPKYQTLPLGCRGTVSALLSFDCWVGAAIAETLAAQGLHLQGKL